MKKSYALANILRYVSSTRCSTSVKYLHHLYDALHLVLLRYSIPVLHEVSRSTVKDLESIQTQPLRVCLGLPRSTPTVGPFAEAGVLPLVLPKSQETIRVYLRHLTQHRSRQLSSVVSKRPTSGFSSVLVIVYTDLLRYMRH